MYSCVTDYQDGYTPLRYAAKGDYAAMNGHLDVVKALVEAGADVGARDKVSIRE